MTTTWWLLEEKERTIGGESYSRDVRGKTQFGRKNQLYTMIYGPSQTQEQRRMNTHLNKFAHVTVKNFV